MSVWDDFRYTIMRRERARLGWNVISKERQATTKDWPVQNCQFDIDLRQVLRAARLSRTICAEVK